MAIRELENEAIVTGYIDGVSTAISDVLVIQLVDGLELVKEADKEAWATGELMYTVRIINNSGVPYEGVTFSDVLDPDKVTLVENTVQIDSVPVPYAFTPMSGVLYINPDPQLDVPDGGEVRITFRVSKV